MLLNPRELERVYRRTENDKQRTRSFPIAALLCALVSCLIFYTALPSLQPPYKIVGFGASIGLLAATLLAYFAGKSAWLHLFKWITVYYFIIVLVVTAVFYVTKFLIITDEYGMEELFRNNIDTAKRIYMLLCFLQPIALPVPEAVTVVAGSAVFGPLQAFVLAFTGTLLGIVVMFAASRVGGMKLVAKLVQPAKLERYHRYVAKNETLIMALLFMIPVLPDEIICVGAGISGVKVKRFVLVAAVSKLITSFLLAYSVYLTEWLNLTPTQLVFVVSGVALAGLCVWLAIRKLTR